MLNLMKKSYELRLPIQEFIEYKVTNGLGYDSETKFDKERKVENTEMVFSRLYSITEEDVKNTEKGLKAHLFDMQARVKLPFLEVRHDYFSTTGGLVSFIQRKRHKLAINYYKSNLKDLKESAVVNLIKDRFFSKKPLESFVSSKKVQLYLFNLSN